MDAADFWIFYGLRWFYNEKSLFIAVIVYCVGLIMVSCLFLSAPQLQVEYNWTRLNVKLLAGRMRRIHNFFSSLQSKYKRIWILFASYSHVSVYSETPVIRIICLLYIRYKIFAQIHMQIFIFSYWQKVA